MWILRKENTIEHGLNALFMQLIAVPAGWVRKVERNHRGKSLEEDIVLRRKSFAILASISPLAIIMIFLVCPGQVLSQDHPRQSILILYSLDSARPANSRFFNGFDKARRYYGVGSEEIYQEFMDVGRFKDEDYNGLLRDYLKTKYSTKKIDLIIAVHVPALDFMVRQGASVFPGIPFISAVHTEEALEKRKVVGKVPSVIAPFDVRGTVELILRLQPGCKNLYILYGSNPAKKTLLDAVKGIEAEYDGKIKFTYLTDLARNELMKTASSLPGNSAILTMSFLMDKNGATFTATELGPELSQLANCPVYCLFDILEYGMVGGSIASNYRLGQSVGDLAHKILSGENATDRAPVVRVAPAKMVNGEQMLRWALSERDLPDGYQVVNMPASFWRDYKRYAVVAILFFAAQSTMIVSLLVQRMKRRATELKLLGTLDTLRENREELSRAFTVKDRLFNNLRESEATVKTILSSVPVAVFIVEAESRIIRQANHAAGELLGKPVAEVVGNPFSLFFGTCDKSRCAVEYSAEKTEPFEDCMLKESGRETYVLRTVDRAFLDEKPHFIECFLDIANTLPAELFNGKLRFWR